MTAAYYYFCLDCEASRDGCRVPLTMDIASHVVERRHTNFQPIEQVLPDTGYVSLENLSYNKTWNKKVKFYILVLFFLFNISIFFR